MIAYAALFVVVIYPLIILYLNLIPIKKLQSSKFKERTGVIYEELYFRYGKKVMLWPLFLNLHRLTLAYMLVFVSKYQFAQLFAVNFLSVTHLIILGAVEPFKERWINSKELAE